MNKEMWRPINGYKGLYEVSDQGRIKNTKTGKILKPKKAGKGYLQICLVKNKKKHFILFHRLVAYAFPEICGEWFEGCQINHKNENKWDNRAVNLEVCTCRYNINWGTGVKRRAEKQLNRKDISKQVARYTREWVLIDIFPSLAEAQRKTNVHTGSISRGCRTGSLEGGTHWKYL